MGKLATKADLFYEMDHLDRGRYFLYNYIEDPECEIAIKNFEESLKHLGFKRSQNENFIRNSRKCYNIDCVLSVYLSQKEENELEILERFHSDKTALDNKPKIIFFLYQPVKSAIVTDGCAVKKETRNIAKEADIFVVKIITDNIVGTLGIIQRNIQRIDKKVLLNDFLTKLQNDIQNDKMTSLTSINSGRKRLFLGPKAVVESDSDGDEDGYKTKRQSGYISSTTESDSIQIVHKDNARSNDTANNNYFRFSLTILLVSIVIIFLITTYFSVETTS